MGLLNIIRRMALREKQSIREISRRTGLSRNTIAKYLSAGTIEPTFTVPERPSKLDPFADKLAGWLKTEAGRSRKQRRTLKQLHADLVVLGFTGSYGRVAAFARDWRAEQLTAGRGIFVPLSFRPGEAFQFDWSEDYGDCQEFCAVGRFSSVEEPLAKDDGELCLCLDPFPRRPFPLLGRVVKNEI